MGKFYITDGQFLIGTGYCNDGHEGNQGRDGEFSYPGDAPESLQKKPIPMHVVSANTKSERNQLLLSCDWTDTLSAKTRLGDELYNAWQTYRQALRDITKQPGYPLDVVWPTPPA